MKRATRRQKKRLVTFGMGILATREQDASTLFERARGWNRIAHMDGTRNRRLAYASKTDALVGALRVHPGRFRISCIEEGGLLTCVRCDRTLRRLHVERAELEHRCPEWWELAIKTLRGEASAIAPRAA